jgi:hypothetical protein
VQIADNVYSQESIVAHEATQLLVGLVPRSVKEKLNYVGAGICLLRSECRYLGSCGDFWLPRLHTCLLVAP